MVIFVFFPFIEQTTKIKNHGIFFVELRDYINDAFHTFPFPVVLVLGFQVTSRLSL